MKNFSNFINHRLKHCSHIFLKKLAFSYRESKVWLSFLFQVNPFWAHLTYFLILSFLGFVSLKTSKQRPAGFIPKDVDLFFTAVSATTVSSLSTVEMEAFSNAQLWFLTIMMLFGGEVFISMFGLFLTRVKLKEQERMVKGELEPQIQEFSSTSLSGSRDMEMAYSIKSTEEEIQGLKSRSIVILSYIVTCFVFVVHATGSALIFMYFRLIPSAREILETKNLRLDTFSIFMMVSNFANCGFIPTNENMMIFKKHSGLLLIAIPQLLVGNVLYPACLHLIISFLARFVPGNPQFRYMLENSRELGYWHLLPGAHCTYQTITCFGFLFVQLMVFCSLEWNSKASVGLNGNQKLVGSLFQVVNSRHGGESVFDLSEVSPAILVLFVLMMYLPPYITFLPLAQKISTSEGDKTKKRKDFWGQILFSQLAYLTIFIILICIIEREKMKIDPLNFNVLSMTVEVISAYGNVGFSIGYDCGRRLNPYGECKNEYYGLVGRWSDGGKLVIIIVMLFGRLKKFNMRGGRAWIPL